MTSAANGALALTREQLIGTWKLLGAVDKDVSTEEATPAHGAGATGYISYGADGRMNGFLVHKGRKKPAGDVATGPEAEALFRTMTSYVGSYTLTESHITHHVDASWNEAWTGRDLVREYKLDGNRLSLAMPRPPAPNGDKVIVRELRWEKVK